MRGRALRTWVMFLAAVAAIAAHPRESIAGFEIVSESVKVDALNNAIVFELLFSEAPDFSVLDADGTQQQAFQYEIDGDWVWGQDSFGFDRIDSVIRGIEIHEEGDLRIRDTRPSEDPDAGGWGRILESVPFHLDGPELSFSVRKDLIDDSNGKFQYRVFALDNGEMTTLVQRQVVPLPTAVWSGLSLFGGLCALRIVQRLRARAVI